jgi:hypothetical protein
MMMGLAMMGHAMMGHAMMGHAMMGGHDGPFVDERWGWPTEMAD